MIALILAGTLAVQSDDSFARTWAEFGPQMEAQGITRPMAETAYIWSEGQYHIGLCRRFLEADDVTFWRNWWDNTPLPSSEYGRAILRSGEVAYTEGLEAAATNPITPAECQRVVDSWMADMRALVQ